MTEEWLSWEQVLQEYTLEQDELVDLCIEGIIPLYNSSRMQVYPIGRPNPFNVEQPRIVWGRIYLAENERLSFYPPEEFSRIIFKGYPETGDFLIFRKDCVPTLQDELLFRVLKDIQFPKILTKDFWDLILQNASIRDRKFIPNQRLTYPSMFISPDFFDIPAIEQSMSKIKQINDELSPSIEIFRSLDQLTNCDEKYEIAYSIEKEGFSARDKITILFTGNEILDEQDSEREDCESRSFPYAHYIYLSEGNDSEYNPKESIWVKFYNGTYLIKTINAPIMKLSIKGADNLFTAPSIQAVAQVERQYHTNDDICECERTDILYSLSSFLTYIENPHENRVLLDKYSYCIFNGIYKDTDNIYKKYLSSFITPINSLSEIKTRTMTFNKFKEDIISELRELRSDKNDKDRKSILALAIKLDTYAKNSEVYVKTFEALKMPNKGHAENKNDGAKRKYVSELLAHGELLVLRHAPTMYPLPKWKTYTTSQAQREYFVSLAKRKGIKLLD